MASIAAGTVLGNGRYKIVKELNRGGTAVVYQGLDLTSGATVALKVMSVKDGRASVPIKAVIREIEYAASVQHENVVKLVDYVADERQIIIVWELISGSDLLDLLNERGGRMDEGSAAGYFAQLLQGLTFIHAHGLCHRDIKPENCMVERATNKLKIIDFGLSKHQQSAVTLGVGTPDYMAPELLGSATGGFSALQERRVGQYDAKACDVWAMGVMLYLLVSGQYPFEDPMQPQNVVATLHNISQGKMRPMSRRLSPECADLIAAMLNKDPAQRITLQAIAHHPWLRNAGVGGGNISGRDGTAAELNQRASFTFPAATALPAKPTPSTPKVMIALKAHAAPAASSPTVSAPHAMSTPARDGGVSSTTATAAVGDEASKKKWLSGFCKVWGFGSSKAC